jgi:hypothetical protein
MKIYISENTNKIAGFTRLKGGTDLAALNEICSDSEATEIIIENILGHLPSREVDTVLENCVAKLRHKGVITVIDVALDEVARLIFNKKINLLNANILLYGNQDNPVDFRMSALTAADLCNTLRSYGLTILKNRYSN